MVYSMTVEKERAIEILYNWLDALYQRKITEIQLGPYKLDVEPSLLDRLIEYKHRVVYEDDVKDELNRIRQFYINRYHIKHYRNEIWT